MKAISVFVSVFLCCHVQFIPSESSISNKANFSNTKRLSACEQMGLGTEFDLLLVKMMIRYQREEEEERKEIHKREDMEEKMSGGGGGVVHK